MSETFVTITGNLTANPRLLFGKESGQPFAVFRLAQNRARWDRERGQRIQVGTNYVEVVAFRTLGLNVYESVAKGDPVIVQGRLKVTDWTNVDRQGTTVQVQAEHVGFDFAFGQGSFKKVLRPQVPGRTRSTRSSRASPTRRMRQVPRAPTTPGRPGPSRATSTGTLPSPDAGPPARRPGPGVARRGRHDRAGTGGRGGCRAVLTVWRRFGRAVTDT
jgi:single-strand DNA-binding protein